MKNFISNKTVSAIKRLKKEDSILSYLHDSIDVDQWNERREQVKQAKGVEFISKVDAECQIRFAQFMPIGKKSIKLLAERMKQSLLDQYGSMFSVSEVMMKRDDHNKLVYPRWLIFEITGIKVDRR